MNTWNLVKLNLIPRQTTIHETVVLHYNVQIYQCVNKISPSRTHKIEREIETYVHRNLFNLYKYIQTSNIKQRIDMMTVAKGDIASNLINYSKGYIISGNTQTKAISFQLKVREHSRAGTVLTNDTIIDSWTFAIS